MLLCGSGHRHRIHEFCSSTRVALSFGGFAEFLELDRRQRNVGQLERVQCCQRFSASRGVTATSLQQAGAFGELLVSEVGLREVVASEGTESSCFGIQLVLKATI